MRGPRLFMSCFAAACLASSPVSAEDKPPPSPIFSSPYDFGPEGDPKAFADLLYYATCVVHLERGVAARLLAVSYPSKDRDGQVHDLIAGTGVCMDGAPIKLAFRYLRGALIEGFYQEDILKHSGKPLIKIGTSVEKIAAPPALVHCIVNRRPDAAAELLRTRISSVDQVKGITNLEPDIAQCERQTKAGSTYPELLRFQIAEDLYRRASSSAAAAK